MTNQQIISKVFGENQKNGLLTGNCEEILAEIPDESIGCVITSPPYWQMRKYSTNAKDADSIIGDEKTPEEYVKRLAGIFRQIKRVLKADGSVWLNLGDKYHNKNLMGMPWRVALAMQDDGWILRNDVIWHQIKGTQSAKDRLRDVYEHIFHFVKSKKYYYDSDMIRIKPSKLPTINGKEIISATGVSGKKYRRQILESKELNEQERVEAIRALDQTLEKIREGELVDFRMTIRGTQRTFHSDNLEVSGRAKELETKGFYILTSKAKGCLPSDIWNIVPEDEWRKDVHYAVFPTELLEIPIKATSRVGSVVLDPFMGTGSTLVAANQFNRQGLGIELSEEYVEIARNRLNPPQLSWEI
jgi:site-specific DNA-methyltransferase (adenine-specific)